LLFRHAHHDPVFGNVFLKIRIAQFGYEWYDNHDDDKCDQPSINDQADGSAPDK
jgi:hypothetical protein